jgi:hypothetical protein
MRKAQAIKWPHGLLVAISCSLLSTAGLAVTIDDFSDGDFVITATDNLPGTVDTQTDLSPDAVIGGARRAILGSISGPPGATADLNTELQQLTLTSDPNFNGYLDLEYGFDTPLGVDLTADGADRFEIEMLSVSADVFPGLFKLNLDTGIIPIAADSVSFADQIFALAGGSGTIVIPFLSISEHRPDECPVDPDQHGTGEARSGIGLRRDPHNAGTGDSAIAEWSVGAADPTALNSAISD